jgi:BlaI family penicillinase repressor
MKTPRISDHEWEVMKVIWSRSPCTAGQVIEELSRQDATWHPKTVKTFLTRLVNKQVLAFRKEGRAYHYFPLFSEKECVRAASESFLQRVFGGSLRPMLAHFIEEKKLSRREVQELKKILEEGGGK